MVLSNLNINSASLVHGVQAVISLPTNVLDASDHFFTLLDSSSFSFS